MQSRTHRSYVGQYFGQRQVEITPEIVANYADAVEDHHPWYTEDSPFGGPVAPALVLHSEVYKDLNWYLPNVYGNLHARQEWELFHPMMVGETVTASGLIVDRYVKRGREYVVKEVSVFGGDGRLLNRGRTHQSFLLQTDTPAVVVDKEREKRADRRFEAGQAEALEEVRGPEKQITVEMCRKFSGPHKNYHTDIEEAKKFGFPDIVVQGMMSLCFLSEMMTERFGEGWFCGGRMNANLVNVVWGGDRLTCRGQVYEISPEGPVRRAQVNIWCEKTDGTKVVVGTASAVVA